MVGLAGVPAGEIDGLKDSILDLAGETAVAPQELADALYDAASAGLTSAQALEAVQVAAKGASAGMGTTGDIVGLVASATASYGAEVIVWTCGPEHNTQWSVEDVEGGWARFVARHSGKCLERADTGFVQATCSDSTRQHFLRTPF